jgi:hypothetical protein
LISKTLLTGISIGRLRLRRSNGHGERVKRQGSMLVIWRWISVGGEGNTPRSGANLESDLL